MRGETVLELDRVDLAIGRRAVFRQLSARFARGQTTAILGATGSGKSSLASLMAGAILPSAGEVLSRGRIAPVIGQNAGLGETANLGRDLGTRASAYGLNTSAYCQAVAHFAGDPQCLDRPYDLSTAAQKGAVNRAAALLIPADIYVSDGLIVPAAVEQVRENTQDDGVISLLNQRRRQAAVIWITGAPGTILQQPADRFALLHRGALHFFETGAELILAYSETGHAVPRGVMRTAERALATES
ncbi:MAG: ATP-binding cassette domain-containing protein [Pseudomonadota bacterium]